MPSDLEPQQMPPAVPQNYEHKQKLEGQRPNNTQVNSSYRVRMIAQKCPPILRWRPSASAHVLGNRRLGDFESEHQKLTVNPGGAPQRILLAHPLNEFAQAAINPWSPRPPPRFPSPKGPEARTMPTQDRLGLNHVGRAKKAGPNPYQPDHKHSITVAQLETRRPPSQCDTQLMTEEQVLGFKPHTRPEYVGDEPSKQLQDRKHRLNDATILPYDANPRRTKFSERTPLSSAKNYFFLAPARVMLLIASGARPDFSAISRSCSIMKPRAGLSFSRPPSNSAGTRRLERCEPSSYTTSKNTNSPLGLVPGFFAIASYARIPFLLANPIVRGSRHAFSLQIGSTKISTNRGAP